MIFKQKQKKEIWDDFFWSDQIDELMGKQTIKTSLETLKTPQ